MATEFKTEKLMVKKERLARNFEQLIENDLSLPDYCGDIVKILNCCAVTNIFSAAVTGDKAVIDGAVVVRILYVDAAAKTEVYEVTTPFNRSIDAKGAAEGDAVEVICVSEQISCRAVNQRRADIRGSVTMRVSITGCDEVSIITEVPDGFCHTLGATVNGGILKARCSKCFTLTASSEAEERFRNAKIVRAVANPSVSEIRTIKNKMMIRGNTNTDITLLDSSGNFITSRVQLPMNQIIDLDGIDEDSVCNVTANVTALDVRMSPETASTLPRAEVTATVCALIEVTERAEISAFSEAYAPHHDLVCESTKIKYISDVHRINETHALSVKFDFSACKASSVCDVSIRKIRYTVNCENKAVVMRGNVHFGITVMTAEGEKLFFERISDFEHKLSAECETGETDFRPVVTPCATESSVSQDGTVTVHTEFRIDGYLYCMKEFTALSSIEKGEKKNKDNSNTVFTVYFASKGERLWDIAKAHNTSAEKIKCANADIQDVTETDCMLVFEQE